MEIFYLKKSEIIESINFESLEAFSDGKIYSSQEKYIDHLLGLFLVKFVAKNIYDVENYEIEVIDKKPFFKSRRCYFSISHSKDVVLVAFDNNNIGADVEYIQERQNYQEILNRYNQNMDNPTLVDFYKFWTLHESKIKLNSQYKSSITGNLEKDYMYSCVSGDILVTDNIPKKIIFTGKNIDLVKEFKNSNNCKIVLGVE